MCEEDSQIEFATLGEDLRNVGTQEELGLVDYQSVGLWAMTAVTLAGSVKKLADEERTEDAGVARIELGTGLQIEQKNAVGVHQPSQVEIELRIGGGHESTRHGGTVEEIETVARAFDLFFELREAHLMSCNHSASTEVPAARKARSVLAR